MGNQTNQSQSMTIIDVKLLQNKIVARSKYNSKNIMIINQILKNSLQRS